MERIKYSSAIYQSTNLRVGITSFIPIQMGVSAGFDYGGVCSDNENDTKWHNDYGGLVRIYGFSALTSNLGLYHGDDGNRFVFSLGFNF